MNNFRPFTKGGQREPPPSPPFWPRPRRVAAGRSVGGKPNRRARPRSPRLPIDSATASLLSRSRRSAQRAAQQRTNHGADSRRRCTFRSTLAFANKTLGRQNAKQARSLGHYIGRLFVNDAMLGRQPAGRADGQADAWTRRARVHAGIYPDGSLRERIARPRGKFKQPSFFRTRLAPSPAAPHGSRKIRSEGRGAVIFSTTFLESCVA